MSDNRTTAEKLKAEADTQMRVKTEGALAYLRGKYDAMNEEHTSNDPSIIALLHHQIDAMQTILRSGIVPLPPQFQAIDATLDALQKILPAR